MKRILLLLIITFCLFSCKKQYEFSCDPKINQLVVENKKEFSQLDLNGLLSYSPKVQRAIFNSWDYQKKRKVWLEKLYSVSQNPVLNSLEKRHIQILIENIDLDYFQRKHTLEDRNFTEGWIKYSHSELKWTKKFVAFVGFRLYTNQIQLDKELIKAGEASRMLNSEGSCDCSTSSDYCGGGRCTSGNCSSSTGCGWLWSMPCNGGCY